MSHLYEVTASPSCTNPGPALTERALCTCSVMLPGPVGAAATTAAVAAVAAVAGAAAASCVSGNIAATTPSVSRNPIDRFRAG